jgi:hypothetical protein
MNQNNRRDDVKDLHLATQNVLFWLIDSSLCDKYQYGT